MDIETKKIWTYKVELFIGKDTTKIPSAISFNRRKELETRLGFVELVAIFNVFTHSQCWNYPLILKQHGFVILIISRE